MKIPHLVKGGQFKPVIRRALEIDGCHGHIDIKLPKGGGYDGEVYVTIESTVEKEFEAEVSLNDWTRFPARIRAAATALRDAGCYGRFRITHSDGILTIKLA